MGRSSRVEPWRVGALTSPDPRSLAFAASRPPLPLDNGSRIRSHRLLTGLSRRFDVTFVTFEHDPRSPDGGCSRADLERALPGVELVTVPGRGRGKRLGQARSLLSSRSWAFGRYHLPAFGEALTGVVERRHPAILHFEDLGVGQFGPRTGPFNVYAPHNVEHTLTERTATSASGTRAAFARLEAAKLRREETRLYRGTDLCVAVSEVDARAMAGAGARAVAVCPNGTDEVARLPSPRRRPDEALRLLFVGSADYLPYERGIAWLVREVLPRARETTPVTLDVVGAPPRRPVAAPGVAYVGRVPSVAEWYERSHAVVVPMFEGGGTRLKIVEAMAYGRPVVSTSLGAEGLPVVPGAHFLQADDAEAFASALRRVARETVGEAGGLGDMLDRAREAVEPLFWPRIVDALVDLYGAAVDGRASGRRRR